MPAYGPEQRGGTANVTVIVSDERMSSPILSQYDTAIILNQKNSLQRCTFVLSNICDSIKDTDRLTIFHFEAYGRSVSYTHLDVYKRQPRPFKIL